MSLDILRLENNVKCSQESLVTAAQRLNGDLEERNLVPVNVANEKRQDKLKEKKFYGQLLDLRDSLVFRFIKLYFIESHISSSAIDSDCKLL